MGLVYNFMGRIQVVLLVSMPVNGIKISRLVTVIACSRMAVSIEATKTNQSSTVRVLTHGPPLKAANVPSTRASGSMEK